MGEERERQGICGWGSFQLEVQGLRWEDVRGKGRVDLLA